MTDQTIAERGKRRAAFRTEVLIVLLIVAAMFGVPNALEIFKIAFIPFLAYAGTLRGLDAKYNA